MTTDDLCLFLRSQRRQPEPPFTFHTIIMISAGVAVVQGPSKLKPDRDCVCGVRGAEDDAAADRK
eukprot:2282154-Rhodomonas_salina.1